MFGLKSSVEKALFYYLSRASKQTLFTTRNSSPRIDFKASVEPLGRLESIAEPRGPISLSTAEKGG